jgi:hypothetical protein
VLAPGLVLYKLPDETPDKTAELIGQKKLRGKLTLFTPKDSLPIPAAPEVDKIVHTKRTGRLASASTQITTKSPAPDGVIAIVIVGNDGKARSFGRVEKGSTFYGFQHGRCGVLPNGTVESKIGETVTVFWVDKYGQKSAPSKPVKITGTVKDGG